MQVQVYTSFINLRSAFNSLGKPPFLTIATIDGLARGGDLEMAISWDLRVAGWSPICLIYTLRSTYLVNSGFTIISKTTRHQLGTIAYHQHSPSKVSCTVGYHHVPWKLQILDEGAWNGRVPRVPPCTSVQFCWCRVSYLYLCLAIQLILSYFRCECFSRYATAKKYPEVFLLVRINQ